MKMKTMLGLTLSLLMVPGMVAFGFEPKGSIDFVCPYSAGGGSDVMARTIASVMQNYTDANPVVQNLSGGTDWLVQAMFTRRQEMT